MKDQTLHQIITERPYLTELLNRKHIDYCCHGDMTLEQAARKEGFDTMLLQQELLNYRPRELSRIDPHFQDLSPEKMIAELESTHHKDERLMLTELDALLQKILLVHYRSHKEELLKVYHLFSELKTDLIGHFAKEEREVFPMILKGKKEDEETVRTIESEHQDAGEILKELTEVTDDFRAPDDACQSFRRAYTLLQTLTEDIYLHIFKETAYLLPKYYGGIK